MPDTYQIFDMPGRFAKSGSQQGTKQEHGTGTTAAEAADGKYKRARVADIKEAGTGDDPKPSPGWLQETQKPAAPVRPFTRAKCRGAAAASANEQPAANRGSDRVAKQEPPAEAGPASQKGLAGRRGAARLKRAGAEGQLGSGAPGPSSTERRSALAEPVRTSSPCQAEERGAGRSKHPCRQGRSRTAADRSFIEQFTAEAGGLPSRPLSKSPGAVDEVQQEAGQSPDAGKAPPVHQPLMLTATPAEGAQAMPERDGQPGAQPDDILHPSQSDLSAGGQLHQRSLSSGFS